MVAAAHPAGHRGAPRDRRRLPAGRRNRAPSTGQVGTAAAGKTGQRGDPRPGPRFKTAIEVTPDFGGPPAPMAVPEPAPAPGRSPTATFSTWPYVTSPFTSIDSSGRWCSHTHLGTECAVLLVRPAYRSPAATDRPPKVGGDVLAVVVVRGKRYLDSGSRCHTAGGVQARAIQRVLGPLIALARDSAGQRGRRMSEDSGKVMADGSWTSAGASALSFGGGSGCP